MRVLGLGATGRLGAMLRRAWAKEADLAPLWQTRAAAPGPGWVQCDILNDPGKLAALCAEADVILTLAGVTPASGGDLALNTDLGLAVQEAIRKAANGCPHLLASSAAVYGRAEGLCREEGPALPVAPYGQAKRAMEEAVLAAGTRVTCLRIGNVAGADQILGRISGDAACPPLSLDQFADGRTPRRSYIGPATLGRVLADLVRATGQGRALPTLLNIAAPGAVEMGALLEAAGHPWTPRPAPEGAIAEVALDTRRLSRFTALDPASGSAAALVAEWRAFQQAREPQ